MFEEDYEDGVASLSDLREAVENEGDLIAVPMWVVRDAYGAERLGKIVRQNIATALANEGLGSVPMDVPDRQYEIVRIYRLGTGVAQIIDAVLKPTTEGDVRLRSASSSEALQQINRIREIVCG
jgi:nitroreductase